MRPFIGSLIVAGFLSGTVSAQTSPEQDGQEIRSVVAEYLAARNNNSPEPRNWSLGMHSKSDGLLQSAVAFV